MKINTRNFGEIEIDQEKIIEFDEGLPGFEELHHFSFIDSEEGVFNYLQCVDNTDVCFVITDPYEVDEHYAPIINESYFEKLGNGKNEEFVLFSIVCLREPISESTINLAGPLLIHAENKKGIQVITEDKKYSTKEKLFKRQNEVSDIC